jgi:hypothetical protein
VESTEIQKIGFFGGQSDEMCGQNTQVGIGVGSSLRVDGEISRRAVRFARFWRILIRPHVHVTRRVSKAADLRYKRAHFSCESKVDFAGTYYTPYRVALKLSVKRAVTPYRRTSVGIRRDSRNLKRDGNRDQPFPFLTREIIKYPSLLHIVLYLKQARSPQLLSPSHRV